MDTSVALRMRSKLAGAVLIAAAMLCANPSALAGRPLQCPPLHVVVFIPGGPPFCAPKEGDLGISRVDDAPPGSSTAPIFDPYWWLSDESQPFSGNHLGMYTSPGLRTDAVGEAGASVTHSNGYGLTDTAGAATPGSASPSYRRTSGGGGIAGDIDATRFFDLSANQKLMLGAAFDARSSTTTYGTTPALAAGGLISGAGSEKMDTYTLGLFAAYRITNLYLLGTAAFDWSSASLVNNVTIGQGGFNARGVLTDVTVGNVFTLIAAAGTSGRAGYSGMVTKAPPLPAPGYALKLDLSGHAGYRDERSGGFTDSSGFAFGTDRYHFWNLGGRARLFAEIADGRFLWTPYVSATLDQRLDFSHTSDIPAQAGIAADEFSFGEARTFWGGELGFLVLDRSGVSAGVTGFYTASSDTNVRGGRVFVKVPFNADSAAR